MAASTFHFYEDTFNRLNAALTTYVGTTATNVIASISSVAYTLLMIYMMLYGWSMLRGLITEPVTDFLARMVRLATIVGIALNIGRYNTYVSTFLWNAGEAMAGYVAAGSTPLGNAQYLDVLMSRIYDLGDAYWQKANAASGWVPDLGLLCVAILTWVAGVVATAYGAFLLALSKMALAILLGIGPVFVLLLIFDGTRRFFEAWIGQALNYVFLVVLTAGAIRLIMTIIEAYIGAADAAGVAADPKIDQALPCIVLCLIAALTMMQMPSVASALGGGVAVSTLGAVGWAYGRTKAGFAAMRPTALRRSYNRARSDVRIAREVGGKAAGAPLAVYRRITGANRNRISRA